MTDILFTFFLVLGVTSVSLIALTLLGIALGKIN
jgi:hypothetical protein